jgi:hypothetical protein
MLKKYNHFLFESLVLESVVFYSDKFRKLLKDIDSPVSSAILDLETKDIDTANNFLDIDTKDTISFIPDRKAQEILSQKDKWVTISNQQGFLKHSEGNKVIFDLLEYEPVGNETYHPTPGEKGELLKLVKSPETENTYAKIKFAGGITVINNNYVRPYDASKLPFLQNRQTIRVGRGIKALLSKTEFKFSDSEIEQFVNKYKSAWDKMNDIFRNFEVVSEDKIGFWYNSSNYENASRGTLGSSCMKNSRVTFFDIYMKNPEKCSMLILKNDSGDKIKGRAIVWKLDFPNVTFVDRIYTNEDSDVELFKQYAYLNGWYHKRFQNSSNDFILQGKDSTLNQGDLIVKLKNSRNEDYANYPYLDTLKYFNQGTGILQTEEDSSCILLEDTGGQWVDAGCETCGGDGRVECYDCGGDGTVRCDSCYSGTRRRSTGKVSCGECSGEGEIECGECNGNGKIDDEECEMCRGNGKADCPVCDGDCEVDCEDCGGNGDVECSTCDGDGRLDCPDC